MSIKIASETIENRNLDLPTCSTVSHPACRGYNKCEITRGTYPVSAFSWILINNWVTPPEWVPCRNST